MDLIIIRHGRPVREQRSEGEGSADPPLSDVGLEQARLTAEMLDGEHIDHVVSSTMQRAIQTAEPTASRRGLTIERLEDLCEVDVNRPDYIPAEEMTVDDDIVKEYQNDPLAIFDGDYEGFLERVIRGMDHVVMANRGKRVAVFCHGMVIGVYLQSILRSDEPIKLSSDYCGVTRIEASSMGHRTIRGFNEVPHVRHTLEKSAF